MENEEKVEEVTEVKEDVMEHYNETRERTYTYVFTWNNWDTQDYSVPWHLMDNTGEDLDFCAISFSEEIGGVKKTPHLQGFAQSVKVQRYTTLAKRYGGWWQVARGSILQNEQYVTKQGKDHYEKGVFVENEQGKRSDLEQMTSMLQSGADMHAVAQQFPGQYIRYNRGLDRYKALMQGKPVSEEKTNICLFGDAGTGKSKQAFEEYPDAYRVTPSQNTVYWTGYENEKSVIFDDFTGQVPIGMLLQWMDRYPVQVPMGMGGNTTYLRAKTLIFTSNIDPRDWYPGATTAQRFALMRRFTKVGKFTWAEDGTTVAVENIV